MEHEIIGQIGSARCVRCGLLAEAEVHKMSAWTTEKPTEDGAYWLKAWDGTVYIVKVGFVQGIGFVNWPGRDDAGRVDKMLDSCQWQGPLKPQE